MAEASFGVAYDGPALRTPEMPVRELAPALFALGELFTEASIALYPNREPVSLNIRATEDGSFWVQLALVAKETWDEAIDIWASDAATALANLTAASVGAFATIKWLRGRKPDAEQLPESGQVRLTLPDGTSLEISADAWLLYMRDGVRRKARDVVSPLRRDGIDTFELRPARRASPDLVIKKDDVPAFEAAAEDEDDALTDSERETLVEIVSLAYVPTRKWRLREGAAAFSATIEDAEFWERVHRREVKFAEGDMLRVRLRVIQTFDAANRRLRAKYRVVTVREVVEP